MCVQGWDTHKRMKLGGTSLFTKRTSKRGTDRSGVNLTDWILVKMHILGTIWKLRALTERSLEPRGCQSFNVTAGAKPGYNSSRSYIPWTILLINKHLNPITIRAWLIPKNPSLNYIGAEKSVHKIRTKKSVQKT